MITHSIPKGQVYGRALSIGIEPKVTISFVKDFYKWCDNSGIEWTVNRLKSIKQDVIQFYGLNQMPTTPWVARNSKGYLSGSNGYLMKYAKQSGKCLNKVLTLFNIITICVTDTVLISQHDKFSQAVTTPSDSTPDIYLSLIGDAAQDFKSNVCPRVNSPFALSAPMSSNREKRMVPEIVDFFSTREGMEFIKNDYEVLNPLMSIFGFPGPRFTGKVPYIGSVFCTQNPGLKARFFASPHLWLQHCLHPLGEEIYKIVENQLPWDCTFHQDKPDKIIQDHLFNNKICHSFDLSSATDRFPFDLQLHALQSIFTHPQMAKHISFYKKIQAMPYNYNGKPIVWERGQALGMYPSFGLFTMTHGLLLYALNGFKHNDMFFVLGDDMIILDDHLSLKYEEFLLTCDVPFSKDKSIASGLIAEFAGKKYTKKSVKVIPKWVPLNKQNCLDMIRGWGQSLIPMFPKKHQLLLMKLSVLPYPYGCGFNPEGRTLDERFIGFEDLLVPDNKNLEYSTNTKTLVLQRMLQYKYRTSHLLLEENMKLATDLDKRNADRLMDQGLLRESWLYPIFGKNLYSQNPDLNLPLVGKDKDSG